MCEALFVYPKILARHQAGPAATERKRALAHCAGQGAARATLLRIARKLLVIAERIDVTIGKSVTRSEIAVAAPGMGTSAEAAVPRWKRTMVTPPVCSGGSRMAEFFGKPGRPAAQRAAEIDLETKARALAKCCLPTPARSGRAGGISPR